MRFSGLTAAPVVLVAGACLAMGLASCTAQAGGADAAGSKSSTAASPSAVPQSGSTPAVAAPTAPTPEPTQDATVPAASTKKSQTSVQVDQAPTSYPATPVITFATWNPASARVEASGLVSGQIDASGTCRLTLAKGAVNVVRSSVPQPSASSVSCGMFTIPRAALAQGSWTVRLSYVVGERQVSSSAQTLVVP